MNSHKLGWAPNLQDELSKEELEAAKAECRKLLLREGGAASVTWGVGGGLALFLVSRTPFGARLSLHPYALVATTLFVAPFWIVGERSVLACQRALFTTRRENVGKAFENERFNKE